MSKLGERGDYWEFLRGRSILGGGLLKGSGTMGVHELVGSMHAVAGLTAGWVLRATGATTFAFGALQDSDIPASIARDSELHDAVTLDAATHADDLLGLTGQAITLDTQAANMVLAGPASGEAAAPTMRALVDDDLPDTNVTPGEYGDATHVAVVTVDQQGRLTAASEAAIAAGGGPAPGYYGDGSNGDETIAVDTTLDIIIPYYNNLTIDANKVLTIQSTTIFVKDTLTINGTIRNNGGDGITGSANAAGVGGAGGGAGGSGDVSCTVSAPTNRDGAAGGDTMQNGADGNGADWGWHNTPFVASSSAAQAGANGGAGAVGSGGAGGNGDAGNPGISPRNYAIIITLGISTEPTWFANPLSGGAAGGGGGSTEGGGGAGGAGGDGGDIVIVARHIVWGANGLIESAGGNGGDGGASDGDGGGGGAGAGGNGGIVILCYEDETGTRNVDVSKGVGGTGGTSVSADPGENGPDGYDGVVIDLGA